MIPDLERMAQVDVLQGKSKTVMVIAVQKVGSVTTIVMTERTSGMVFPFSLTVIRSTVMMAIVNAETIRLEHAAYRQACA
jgi:hypothetical protein